MAIALDQIGQISLTVDDVDVAEHFYEEILGLPKLYRFGDLVFFDCAGVRLFITKPETGSFSPASSVLYFRTPDITSSVQEMATRGVLFIDQPHVVAEMQDHDLWMAFFTDPAGNTLALMHEAPKS
jgi:methylmalonyl-CoA/ethylmalonyl-CoA epimerase